MCFHLSEPTKKMKQVHEGDALTAVQHIDRHAGLSCLYKAFATVVVIRVCYRTFALLPYCCSGHQYLLQTLYFATTEDTGVFRTFALLL
jgi:hypothetical protein